MRMLRVISGLTMAVMANSAVAEPARQACDSSVLRTLLAGTSTISPGSLALSEGRVAYAAAIKQPRGVADAGAFRTARVAADGFHGSPSFAFETAPCLDPAFCTRTQTQKIDYHFLNSDRNTRLGLQFGQRRFIGFLLRIDEAAPAKPVILVQLWQGAPHGPPLAMIADQSNGTSVGVTFSLQTAETGSNPSAQRQIIGSRIFLTKGTWYSLIMDLKPTAPAAVRPGEPTIAVYLKQAEAAGDPRRVLTFDGPWGYDYSERGGCIYAGHCETKPPNPLLDFKFGIYRPVDTTRFAARFDNIKLATTLAGADPTVYCAK